MSTDKPLAAIKMDMLDALAARLGHNIYQGPNRLSPRRPNAAPRHASPAAIARRRAKNRVASASRRANRGRAA